MDTYPIRYEFRLDDGRSVDFTVKLDPKTLVIADPWPEPAPDWALLERDRCRDCALATTERYCPTAAHLAGVVKSFGATLSITEADVRVVLPEREYRRRSAVQSSLSSLIGIYMVGSGCPTFAPLRPMVRFHLPFSTELETTFRAASMYLVAQVLRSRTGLPTEWELRGLADVYRKIAQVNFAFAQRLRRAATMDANVNALVLLDVFAKVLPATIEDGLEDLRDIFGPWLSGPHT
ncbi:MAG: hypothetical protein HY901_13425 [Deltaproteobacteria bacterium]|nr:hypothetical protein [Deltaproteobacteria bacterium]